MVLNTFTLYINLYINCGVTIVKVDSNACPARLSFMHEATNLIEHLIPCTSMPEVVEMEAYPTFLNHIPYKLLSSSGHSRGYHMIGFRSLT